MLADKLSFFSNRIQFELFDLLEEVLSDSILDRHRKVLEILEVIQIEKFIHSDHLKKRGRPCLSRSNMARAFIAKHTLNICSTSHLVHMLKVDKNLRYICGWSPFESIPSESTFSRFFNDLSESNILSYIHEYLVKDALGEHIILHCGRDSMPIEVRERPPKSKSSKQNKYERYSKKDSKGKKVTVCEFQAGENCTLDEMINELPSDCSIGKKTKSTGLSKYWRGYKLHMDVGEGKYPLSCILTSASTHDSQAAIPLSVMSSKRSTVLYELMDSAYDVNAIKDYIKSKNRVPLVKPHKRKGKRKELIESNEKTLRAINWQPAEGVRLKHRFSNERLFARLSDSFLGKYIWVRKHKKVFCHVMLGVLSLLASEIIKNIN